EGVTRYLAAAADGRALLDLHEGSDLRAGADGAAVQVDQRRLRNDRTRTDLHVLCDHRCDTSLSFVARSNSLVEPIGNSVLAPVQDDAEERDPGLLDLALRPGRRLPAR